MAVNNKRAVLRLAAGALSLPAAFLLGGCSLRLPQGEAAREPRAYYCDGGASGFGGTAE